MIFSIIEKLSLNNWNTSDTKRRLAVFILFTVGLSVYFGFVEGMTRFEHDMSESYAWGKEFQLGYHQHGFYFAWLAGAWMLLVPHELWAYLILSAVNAIIGMVGACLLIKEFDQGLRGRVATSLLILMPNFTFFAYKWAANVPFIALCPWALLFFVRSIQNISIADGIFFGIMSGLGILNKYFAVVYLVCCALVAVIHINRTKYFSSFVPYISVLVTAIVIAPHLWWLINLAGVPDTTPLDYFSAIIGQDFFVTTYEASRAISGLIQASVAPLILYVYFAAARANNSFKLAGRMIGKLYAPRLQPSLYILGLGPFLITVILAFLFQIKLTAEMFVGIMPLLPLLIVSIFSQDLLVTIEKPLYRLSGLFPIFLFVLGPIVSYVSIAATSSSANITPTKEIALRAEEIWHQETGRPLRLVGGMNWFENVTAFYSADNPHTFIEMNLSRSQWIKRDNIAAYGLLVICEANDIECFARGKRLTTSAAVFKDVTVAHHAWWRVGRDYNFRLIIIPPVDSKNLS